jgi:hypothetical protein
MMNNKQQCYTNKTPVGICVYYTKSTHGAAVSSIFDFHHHQQQRINTTTSNQRTSNNSNQLVDQLHIIGCILLETATQGYIWHQQQPTQTQTQQQLRGGGGGALVVEII